MAERDWPIIRPTAQQGFAGLPDFTHCHYHFSS
jgi:hypothetical protein